MLLFYFIVIQIIYYFQPHKWCNRQSILFCFEQYISEYSGNDKIFNKGDSLFPPVHFGDKMYISANNTNGINPFCDKRKCRYAPNWITLWLTRSTFFCTPHFTQVQTQLSDFRQETHQLCAKNNKLLSYDKSGFQCDTFIWLQAVQTLALLLVTKKCSVLGLGGARGGRAGARCDVDRVKTLFVTSPYFKTLGKLSNQWMHKNW